MMACRLFFCFLFLENWLLTTMTTLWGKKLPTIFFAFVISSFGDLELCRLLVELFVNMLVTLLRLLSCFFLRCCQHFDDGRLLPRDGGYIFCWKHSFQHELIKCWQFFLRGGGNLSSQHKLKNLEHFFCQQPGESSTAEHCCQHFWRHCNEQSSSQCLTVSW